MMRWLLRLLAARRLRKRRYDRGPILTKPRMLHSGFDEAARKRTEERRQQAAQMRSDAARFESMGTRKNKLQVIK